MKSWNVAFTGRFRRMLIFYGGLGSLVFSYLLITGGRKMDSSDWEGYIGLYVFLSLFPIWLPILLVTLSRLVKTKIPKGIEIDSENRLLRIIYSPSKNDTLDFDQLGYSKVDTFNNYVCLTLYKTFIGTRGQLVTKKITDLIGLKRTLSWKKQHVLEIIAELEKNEILELSAEDRELPLWERLI